MVATENVGSIIEADLFKSVQMMLGSGCHGQHRDVSPYEMVAAETVSKQTSSNEYTRS